MEEVHDQQYGERGGSPLYLDVYHPDAQDSLRTAVLMLHGGGWRRGTRKNLAPQARLLQAAGFTAMPAQYSLAEEAAWPAALHDARAAIRWVRRNAGDLGVDADKIALVGFSAGAHISLLAAGTDASSFPEEPEADVATDCSVGAVVAFYPPTAFHIEARAHGTVPADALLGDAPDPDEASRAAPMTYVSPNFPPTFFLHGSTDRVVPASASVAMHNALRTAGVLTDLHIFAGRNHGFDHVDVYREVVMPEVALFLRRTVSQTDEIERRVQEQSQFERPREPVSGGAQ